METLEKTKKEIPLYSIQEDGDGFEFKISNSNNPKVVAQKGVIRIEAIRRSNIKMPRTSFSKVTDPKTGITYGIPVGIDPKSKQLKFQRIIIGEVNEYDLSNPSDRAIWNVISRSPFLVGSPFQSGKPLYKKEDKEADALLVLKKANSLTKAVEIAKETNGLELFDLAIMFGLNPDHSSPTVLQSLLIQKAQDDPIDFCERYDNTNRAVLSILKRCIATGLVKSSVDQGWMWKGTHPLGMTEAAAVGYISKNPALAHQMDVESKQKSNSITAYVKDRTEIDSSTFEQPEHTKEDITNDTLSDADLRSELAKTREARNALLEEIQEVRRLKDDLKGMQGSTIPESSKEPAEKPSPTPAKNMTPEQEVELKKLQKQAHDLGWAKAFECVSIRALKMQIGKRKKE